MGFYVSTKQSVLIILLFMGICVAVGLLAGLMKPPGGDGGGSSGGQVGDGSSTAGTTAPSPSTSTTVKPEPWHDPFLPRNTKPLHYDLYMDPDFYYDGTNYTGRVSIDIEVSEDTRYLIVHIKMMEVTSTQVTLDGQRLDISNAFSYLPNQFWVTELTKAVPAGSVVVLTLEFHSSLVNGIVGFYKSTYFNSIEQRESWLATTKFQPTDARKAFPNFDEPRHKATFTVTLRHWSNFTALGNMPNETTIVDPQDSAWSTTTFQKSYPMSSYLVCFIVCDFEYVEDFLADGTPHRIWASPDKMDQVAYALRVGTEVANFFATEFAMKYHLPKLDQIAIPDFPSGAMEHWGLITYRETALLYNDSLASASAKERVALVIAHELAHNYFGNLVTCEWWDEIWLNEGFANFYEYKGGSHAEPNWSLYFGNAVTCEWWDEIWLNEGFARFYQYIGIQVSEPDWQVDDYFVVRTQQGVMRTDAEASSRPVVVRVTHPDDINQAFDGITYDKGASMLRMIESFMTAERFRNAIRAYLKKHENGTVVTQDLWDALQEEMGSELNVAAVMNPWLMQMGLPVLNLTQSGDEITATPTRFLANPDADASKPDSDYGYQWDIPLTYKTSDNTMGLKWINKTALKFADPTPSGGWVKFNREQRGFVRVNYPENVWNEFANLLDSNHEVFSPIDRSNLLDDALNLARATHIKYPTALGMTSYMSKEMDYFPWRTAFSALNYINNQLYGEPDYNLWRRYVRELSWDVMDRLQVEGENSGHLDNMLRGYIISLACNNGNMGCLQNISAIFEQWINDRNFEVAPNIRDDVYVYGMREVGGEAEWDEMWSRYEQAESAQEALNLLRGIAQAPQLYLTQRYLDFCMDPQKVRTQDFFSAINYAAAGPYGEIYVWNWVQEVYPQLIDRFGIQDRYFGRLVRDIVQDFKTEYRLNEVKEFFAKYPEAGAGEAPRKQAIESIENNIKWKALNEAVVFDWLHQHFGTSR